MVQVCPLCWSVIEKKGSVKFHFGYCKKCLKSTVEELEERFKKREARSLPAKTLTEPQRAKS